MQKVAILFTNWTAEDFSWSWDSVRYDFPTGQSMMLQEHLAHHFARHLAIRELNRNNKPTDKGNINILKAKCFTDGSEIVAENATKLATKVINFDGMKKAELEEVAKEKGIEVKGKKKADIQADLEEFEGLKDEKE